MARGSTRSLGGSLSNSARPDCGFRLEREQLLPIGREELFAFFMEPTNLAKLTPPEQGFTVVSCSTPEIGDGTILEYKLRAHGIPLRWRSRISEWEPPHRFIDEQLGGPFKRWVHHHLLEEHGSSTLVRDSVNYEVWGGRLVERLVVRRELERIFDYRQARLSELFPGR